MFERLQEQWNRAGVVREARHDPNGRSFAGELEAFNRRIVNREPFALARFGDGEMMIINGEATDLSHKPGGEHVYMPGDHLHERQRRRLAAALRLQRPNYHVGIACPCCVGRERFFELRTASGQQESQLTWANLFVNSNYPRFLDTTVDALRTRRVFMVCREGADTAGLPFDVETTFSTGANAWLNDHDRLVDELSDALDRDASRSPQDPPVVLMSAGVLANLLVACLAEHYPHVTAIDIGSVFDPQLGLGQTRRYLKGGRNLKKTCVWLT
ncbi:MAG: hypothetical protein CSB44_04105 [Gammaproteobacteria bacterium]|nr:MAG: hypothetical protein CSB44_04105 [Gammaproteobacteria bacterium]PIE35959.1 MAG: hypothetical protein CSA54_05055 [Gammaproteobacteria bacterium]